VAKRKKKKGKIGAVSAKRLDLFSSSKGRREVYHQPQHWKGILTRGEKFFPRKRRSPAELLLFRE